VEIVLLDGREITDNCQLPFDSIPRDW